MTSWNLTPEQQKLHDLWERHLMCEFATHDVRIFMKWDRLD